MDSIVHGVSKSWTRLSDFHFKSSKGKMIKKNNNLRQFYFESVFFFDMPKNCINKHYKPYDQESFENRKKKIIASA